ncbi:MAG: 4-hydroxy-3-methylbut-2-enyl diphosphate reductase [Bacilli bacterium]|nr:4-hydroxy-3-methylbut-2-enyl diphosphate reductase [Bacilli bacterium]
MIEIGKYAGFCGGVINSVVKSEKALKDYSNLYCLGELVHNKQVVESLEEKGLVFVESLDEVENQSNVIIRAHGVPVEVYEEAKKRGIHLIDLTCPKVLKIHDEVKEYSESGYSIILVGSKKHPEVIGTISFAGEDSVVVETMDDLKEVINNWKDKDKIAVFAQTTYSVKAFEEMKTLLQSELNKSELVIRNTICDATSLRQEECKNMAKEKDCMIIIGGKNSSNTKKLYEVAKEYCKNTYIIETIEDLNLEDMKSYHNIGIMAGASTPKESIEEVFNNLQNLKK